MKLSIIIVNYNVKYFLEQCLNSILASNIDFEYEIILIDNNSCDDSVSYIQTHISSKDIIYIINTDNPGFAKACNQGIAKAKGEYILLLNPDTVLGENVLSRVCSFMDKEPSAGAVGVKMINGSGRFLAESKRGFPSPWASFCKISGLESLFPLSRLFGKYSLRYLNEDRIHKIPILAGAFMMIRKTALDKSGLLDESFFMYGEDIDISYRITQAGYNNYFLPEKIIHYKGESTDKTDKKYIHAFYEAMRLFFKKYYPNYSSFFSYMISSGINLQACVAGLNKKKLHKKNYSENLKTITFDKSWHSYEDIINRMDNKKEENVQFRIFNPNTGITIGTCFTEKKQSHAT